MGTVPTGNKQLGKVSVVAVTSTSNSLQVETLTGAGVLSAQNPPPVIPVKCVGLGVVDVAAVTSNITALHVETIAGFAVLQYLPHPSLSAETVTGLGVLHDSTVQDTSTAPKNLMLGNVALAAVASNPTTMTVETCVAFAVLKKIHPRKEHTTITIEYGAEAELNIGDNS